jgi:hypothetical protein
MLAPAVCEFPTRLAESLPTGPELEGRVRLLIPWRDSHVSSVLLTPLVKIAHRGFMKRKCNYGWGRSKP